MTLKKLWITVLLLILFGTALTGIAISMGAFQELDQIYVSTAKKEQQFQAKKHIRIDLSEYQLHLLPSTDNRIHIEYYPLSESSSDTISIKEENETLILKGHEKNKDSFIEYRGIGVLYQWLRYPDQRQPGSIYIAIPANSNLQTISTHLQNGNINIKNLQIPDLQVLADNGDITLTQVQASKASIQTTSGEITSINSRLSNSTIISDSAAIQLLQGSYQSVQIQTISDSILVDHSLFEGKNRLISEDGDIEIFLSKNQAPSTLFTSQSAFSDEIDLPAKFRNTSNPSVEILVATDNGSISVLE